MTLRLIVCFDGTWNRPAADLDPLTRVETNVCRLYENTVTGDVAGGFTQQKWYDPGVGTDWYDHVRGGVFGLGLDQNIRQGYRWLVDAYPDAGAAEIFVIGFSRGAYTARSLVGMIRNVGLLAPQNGHRVDEAYAIYRRRDESADTDQAKAFRDRYSRDIKIKFLGVWDTVGALGIPLHAMQWLNARQYAFHDTELSGIVENAAHAAAIDEWRVDYQVTLWDDKRKPGQTVEQRWFVGAHADIGGGYADRRLSDITLRWMQQKAIEAGLVTGPLPEVGDDHVMAGPSPSYADFLDGLYAKTHAPYYRSMAFGDGLNQVLDESVRVRWRGDHRYSPRNRGFPLQEPRS
jgi:uncharacterized protein (DUF2235 family)